MELSTSIPTPRARPDREIIFSVIPLKYISTTAPKTLIGMEHATIAVGLISFKNTNKIKIARMAPEIRLSNTEFTTISM